MRPFFLSAAATLIVFGAPRVAAQTTSTFSVTNSTTPVRATAAGYFAVLYEHAPTPAAAFAVTVFQLNGTETTLNVSVGAAYVFSRPIGSSFKAGELLGWVNSTTPGPYNFVLVPYANAPNGPLVLAVKCPTGQSVNQINPDGSTVCLPETPPGQSSIMQWNSALNAVTFTAGPTWSAPVWFSSSGTVAQQNQAGTEFLENTDGQFEIVT